MISTCTACHQVFAGLAAFDAHRIGAYRNKQRRCLTVAEMRANGFEIDKRGRWNHRPSQSDFEAPQNGEMMDCTSQDSEAVSWSPTAVKTHGFVQECLMECEVPIGR